MIRKNATPLNWDKILRGLKKITNLPPKVREYVHNPTKISFQHSSSNPGAVAYVTNEDYNNDGKNDSLKVHIVVPTFNSKLRTSDIAAMAEDSDEFRETVERVASILVHEIEGHINDFDPEDQANPFKGGEPVADAAEERFKPIWASTTNKQYKRSIVSYKEDKMKKDIVKLANHLDRIGHKDLADRLDKVLKMASEINPLEAVNLQEVVDVSPEDAEEALSANEAYDKSVEKIASLRQAMEREFSVAGGKIYK